METIFDFNPTAVEIDGFTHGRSKTEYLNRDKELLIADIAILFLDRNNTEKANEYWAKIPDMHKEFLLGFDNLEIPVE